MQAEAAQFEFAIQGMTCSACSTRLEKLLKRAAGVQQAIVNFASEKAAIRFDASETNVAELVKVVERGGFSVGTDQVALRTGGLHTIKDAHRIGAALDDCDTVLGIEADIPAQTIKVVFVAGAIDLRRVTELIAAAGYAPELPLGKLADAETVQRLQSAEQLAADLRTLKIAIALTVPLVLQMILQIAGYEDSHVGPEFEVWLATPLQFLIGARFYKAAWNALRAGSANMDVLVVLGTTSAYLYSWYLIYTLGPEAEGQLYFEASAVIITLVLLGKYMEASARRRTTDAIRQLMELQPAQACIRDAGGAEVLVPVAEVMRGDLVIVRPGERVPVDGEIVRGRGEFDEALITGESLPVLREPGDAVAGGAINISGMLELRATNVGEDSMLARIIRLVADAQAGKAAVQRLVDRVSAVFVPAVVVVAVATFALHLAADASFEPALLAAVAVLVIACPCALGLATPTAIMTGTGVAARAGILLRDVNVLERTAVLNTVIFDKTGTLTQGRPAVVEIFSPDLDVHNAIKLAAAVQQGSEHPLARAFDDLAQEYELALPPVEGFRNLVGQGVSGQVEGRSLLLGSESLQQQPPSDDFARQGEEWEEQARTVVWLFVNDKVIALFALIDPLRAHAGEAVANLQAAGIDTRLLSGDGERAVASVAREAGIKTSYGRVRPAAKASLVQTLRESGAMVAMVGDGINDAPALAAADVGIAMGSGTDIAMETADITLMRPDIRLVEAAIDVSQTMLRKIRQNLFWAFVYNVIGIPLAAAGYLSPTLAAAAMALSSVSVVSNSLLLRRWSPRFIEPAG